MSVTLQADVTNRLATCWCLVAELQISKQLKKMKLKKIHLSNDRVLSCNDMKFVIGGGDEHSTHDGSWADCPTCQEVANAIYNGGNAAAGYQGPSGGLLIMQGAAYLGSMAYHYLYQGFYYLFGGDGNNSDDNTNDDTTENSNNNGQN